MDLKKEVKEEKETAIRNNSKILDISHLQIKEIEKMNNDVGSERKNEDKGNCCISFDYFLLSVL